MDLRIRALAGVDPRVLPLPHGTEVTTRVDRVLPSGRRVPQGAVGRVVGILGDAEVDVLLVGIGVLRYARSEVLPRRIGQVRYAERRAASWKALSGCVVLEATVGSRAWGLADEGSDTDLRGAFALPLPWTLGLARPPEDLVRADGSATYWEARKLVRQALRADPNTLELLFVDSAAAKDPIGAWILEAKEAFVSREIHGSFGRYAISQLKKLEQSMRLASQRGRVVDWLREEPEADLDRIARRLADSSAPGLGDGGEAQRVLRAKEHVKQLYRSMADQGLIGAADFASLARFARVEGSENAKGVRALELPRELRPKNAYNLIRLLQTAIGWLRTGRPELRVTGPLRDRLLAIKRGEVPLEEVLREAEALAPELDEARAGSPLPPKPDVARADALARRIGQELARRHVLAEPGPFGAGAAEPPEARWDDDP